MEAHLQMHAHAANVYALKPVETLPQRLYGLVVVYGASEEGYGVQSDWAI